MCAYQAILERSHFRAAIRLALQAHGFAASCAEVEQMVEERRRVGSRARDGALRESLPPFVGDSDYLEVAAADPFLWERLPHMLGFGYQQAAILHNLTTPSSEVDEGVALLCATFSAGIALIDYLIDEDASGALVFEMLDRRVVRGIFNLEADIEGTFAGAYERATDPKLRLLCALVAACGNGFRELYRRSGNEAAWGNLACLISRMYEAERSVSLHRPTSRESARALLPDVEAKSVLPFVAVQRIVSLAQPWSARQEHAQLAATTLGRIISLTDDLVDLIDDCHRGVPNAVALLLADRLAAKNSTWPSDADVYDLIDAVAADLTGKLRPDAFGLSEQSPHVLTRAEAGDGAAERGLADARLAGVRDFARLTVAYWVGWQEDDPEAANPRIPARTGVLQCGPVERAAEMLLSQQRDGYREAIHHLRIPRLSPAGVDFETYPCLLFQRAIVLDALLDAYDVGYAVPRQLLSAEAYEILRAKNRYVRGGWNYIPQVPELPPDADDLGMVLQVLVRVGGAALASTCDEAIRLALEAAEEDGEIPTWILDRRGSSPADKALHAYIDIVGGRGAHPDVVSNFLYGLILYDSQLYLGNMLRAVPYFEAAQDDRGAWFSRWYAGPFYGTYRVCSVLSKIAPDSEALKRARRFLLRSQQADGGWGAVQSNPLDTSFASLALIELGACPADVVVERGVRYLLSCQGSDGGWLASPFISFPKSDGVEMHTYASRTITTAFCLKTFVAAGAAAIA